MPEEWLPVLGMIFSLIMIMMIGGFILLFPVSRRLGRLLEERLKDRSEGRPLPDASIEALEAAIHEVRGQLEMLAERQQFIERLLEPGGEARDKVSASAERGEPEA